MYIYIHTRMTCMRICVYIHVHKYIYIYIYICTYIYIYRERDIHTSWMSSPTITSDRENTWLCKEG